MTGQPTAGQAPPMSASACGLSDCADMPCSMYPPQHI